MRVKHVRSYPKPVHHCLAIPLLFPLQLRNLILIQEVYLHQTASVENWLT
jgi:hypothetical protein